MRHLEFTMPLKTAFSLNSREHPLARHRIRKRERLATALAFRAKVGMGRRALRLLRSPEDVARITLTRVGPIELDDDNLRGALKAVRDQLTEELGLKDDRSPRISFAYAQEKSGFETFTVLGKKQRRGIYGVRVRIEIATQEAA